MWFLARLSPHLLPGSLGVGRGVPCAWGLLSSPPGAQPLPPRPALWSMLRVRHFSVSPSVSPFPVRLLKAFYDLSLCFPLVRSGRKGRRRVFSLSEADSHGGHWV